MSTQFKVNPPSPHPLKSGGEEFTSNSGRRLHEEVDTGGALPEQTLCYCDSLLFFVIVILCYSLLLSEQSLSYQSQIVIRN